MANHVSHAALPYPIKNARFTVSVPFLDSDGDPTDPTTPDTEVSQDGGTFADAAEEVTTIAGSNGTGYVTLSGAETNNSLVGIAFKVASGPKATLMEVRPRVLAIVGSGTLSAGSSGGGTLGTILAYDVTGCFLRTTGGTGGGGTGGANNQARRIITYNTSTGAFTVAPNWETTPDNTTTYDVLLPEGVTLGMLKTINPATPGRTLVVDSAGLADANAVKVGPTGSGTAQTARDLGANLDVAVSTRSTYAGADTAGTTTLLSRIGSALTITLGAVNVNDKTGFSLSTAGIKAIWDQATSALTTAGSMGKYLIDSITTLLTDTSTIQTNQATIINRIGAFTGSGVNTILGFFKGLLSKTASTPSDVGGTFDASTDSTEAIRDRGDAAWGSSGSAPQVLVDTTVAVVTDQTHFELTAAVGGNNTYLNQTAVFYDASGSNAPSVRKITAFADASNAITIDSAPDFTVVAGDGIKIFVTPPGTSAPTAAEVATAVLGATNTSSNDRTTVGGQLRRTHALAGGNKTQKNLAATTPATQYTDETLVDGATLVTRTRTVVGDMETMTPS